MEQDERTPRSPEQALTQRIPLFEEDRTRRLPTPLRDAPAPDREPRGKRGKHGKRFAWPWPMAVVGLIGLVLGVVATLLATGATLQRTVADRDARIAELTSQVDQARLEQRSLSARRAALDQRERDLDQRERDLDQRREAVPLPGVHRPNGNLGRDILDRLGKRIQNLVDQAMSGN